MVTGAARAKSNNHQLQQKELQNSSLNALHLQALKWCVCTYRHKLSGHFTRTSSLLHQLAESRHPAATASVRGRLATEWISLKPVVTYQTLDRATEWQMRHVSPLKPLQCRAAWGANWPCPMSGIPWMPASRSQTPADKVGRWMEKHLVFFFLLQLPPLFRKWVSKTHGSGSQRFYFSLPNG